MSVQTGLLVAGVDGRGRHRRAALRQRLASVISTLGGKPVPGATTRAMLAELADLLTPPQRRDGSGETSGSQGMWLALAVLGGALPEPATVERALRTAALRGPLAALAPVLLGVRPGWPRASGPWPAVEVIADRVLVDLHHTAGTELATGIQRVARETARRWVRDHDPVLVGWTPALTGLRRLGPDEHRSALYGAAADSAPGDGAGRGADRFATVVPWRCTYVLPELLTEAARAYALQALLRFSGSRGSMIGFDCVPVTSGETSALGMGSGFSLMLSAAAHLDRIATISGGAAMEYRGWRRMLAGAGLRGPQIESIPLAVQAGVPDEEALAQARRLLVVAGVPMVLVVGSHEPRKNHLAILHAAELLWREGLRFTLVFVGGNSWNNQDFSERLGDLQHAGRPVSTVAALPDELLWAAYRLARCVLFPSLNEGFGLPVAESLVAGTPVITSEFGSMREIAGSGGGALLVNPRRDADVTAAMRTLLTDDEVHGELAAQAREFPARSWDEYAAETWTYLTELPQTAVAAAEQAAHATLGMQTARAERR